MNQAAAAFIRTFEEIAAEVNRRAGEPSARTFEIEKAADRDRTVRNNGDVLNFKNCQKLLPPRGGMILIAAASLMPPQRSFASGSQPDAIGNSTSDPDQNR